MTMCVYVNQILIMSVTRSHPKLSQNVLVPRINTYIWETADETEPTVGIQFQVRLKWHIEYWEQVLKAPDHITESIRVSYG